MLRNVPKNPKSRERNREEDPGVAELSTPYDTGKIPSDSNWSYGNVQSQLCDIDMHFLSEETSDLATREVSQELREGLRVECRRDRYQARQGACTCLELLCCDSG